MKIAFACEGAEVTAHFGHCENFTIFEVENKQVIKKDIIASPGHKPGLLPVFLDELGVNVIISGGMGGGAIDIFASRGIEVITGASGNVDKLINEYLQGNIKSGYSVCEDHTHHGNCEH